VAGPATELEASDDDPADLTPERIRRERTRRGWSKAELGRRVGVSGMAVYYWEAGRNTPTGENRLRLRQLFDALTDEEAVKKAAQAIRARDRAHGAYAGITADDVITAHVGDWEENVRRWGRLMRRSLRRAHRMAVT
jgi:transcriptional regulator with XRE-family HTH domain